MIRKAIRRVYDHRDSTSLAASKRAQRGQQLAELVRSFDRPIQVLDVGGRPQFWGALDLDESLVESVLLLNFEEFELGGVDGGSRYRAVVGDARDLSQFEDRAFDLVVSNSVIEHVGSREDQRRMANEVRRVARSYFVQTPNYWFPIEPHFVFPLFQYLPIWLRTRLHHRFDLGWRKRAPTRSDARASVESVKLLKRKMFQSMFPDGEVTVERFAGLAKSFVVVRRSESGVGSG